MVLNWADPGNGSITGYVILRRIPRDDPEGHFDELVADTGSAATTYTDNEVAASTTYTYRIKAINGHGVSERSGWFHIDTSPAPEPVNSPATGEPTISGMAQVGETLTANTSSIADEDGVDDVSFTYQWLADDSEIAGATNATNTLAADEEGKVIKVRVSFTDDVGNAESLTSAATETVAAAEPGRSSDEPTGPDVGGPRDSGQGAVYTYEDGDRTIRVILQGDLVVQETGADKHSDGAERRAAGGDIVRKQSGRGGADLPVFRSASGGALMTLPGGVLLALDPDWDRAGVNGFFARNNISKTRVSELDYIPNGFFVQTKPGFPSLEVANALASQKGVLVSSPNWWREVEAKQDSEETKGDGGRAAQEAGDIEDGFMNASDLPLGTTYNDSIDPPEDYDFFKLDLSSQTGSTDVRIYTTGEFDTSGLLFDSDEMLLISDNDGIGTRNFSMLASLLSGVYYVVVFGAPYAYSFDSTDIGNYTLHAEVVTVTSVSLDSSMAPSIGAATAVDYFRLDLSDQTEDTDLSLFTVSDDLMPFIEAPSGSLDALRTVDALGDKKWVVHWSDDSLSPGVYPFAVGSRDGDTGGYTLRVATVPDHGSTRATATTLILDAPTSGKFTSTSDADYFKLELTEAKDLAILAFARVNAVILDSSGTEIPVHREIVAGGFNRIIDDFASGTYYVKITGTVYVSDGPLVSNSSQPPATTVDMWANAFAQPFTTGNHSAGYPLSSVEVVSQDAEGDEFTVAVYTVDDDGIPATLHAPLTAPDSFAAGTLVFTAPANIRTLKPNTTYALVFNRLFGSTAEVSLGSTTSDAEDSGPAAGWSIANNYLFKRSDSTVWQQTGTRKSIRIAIEGPATADYALYAYEDTGYGTWVDGCADDTNDLGSSTINDPLYACQWHLNSDDSADMDMNVESVWADGITGAGVNVAVVDETIDYSHADLSSNINSALNHDYGGRGNAYRPAEHHGTNVAGVIAARDNTIGVRGVAPRATIYGYNLLEEGGISTTDADEADAMARNRVATAVSNNSWGPVDGYGFDHAPAMWEMAIDSGVTEGYAGKGVFYAWAGGNGGRPGVGFIRGDNSNFDEYANYYGVTAVCAVGDDGIRAAYSERGANLWACAPSGGGDRGIVTTENSDRYINDFGGTSSATPKVAGVAAILRHANPDLTWRDLKLILAASARQNDPTNIGWEEGARKYGTTDDADRYHFNHEYGFGVVDAAAAVALARDWHNLPEFKNASSASGKLDRTIPDYTASGITSSLSLDTEIDFTEFVEITVTIDHIFWRDLRIELVSPAGRVSTLAVPVVFIGTPIRPADSTISPATFRFGSAKHLGENPNGKWTLRVTDELEPDQGTLQSWSIRVYGHRDAAPDLVVDPPTVSDSNPAAGTSFTLSATVRNQGSVAAGSTTLTYYRSTNATIATNDTSVGTRPVSSLSAGASSLQSFSATAPASAGTYYYRACVGTVTNESDTTNNCSAAVRVTVGTAPVFSEGASTERSVVENTVSGLNVGAAVTATDADNDTLTYRLEGTDAASFSIVSTRGQIQTSAELNHEARSRYSVTVRADDGKGGTATIGVIISVTDVNEPPTVHGEDHLTLFENDDLSASYSASDPEGVASTFTWSVAGTDRADFNIDRSTGELTFRNTPNYESPADSNRDNVYVFTVRATDGGGLIGSLEVTATVANVDEPPTITGSATPPDFPENGVRSVATYQATDPEGRTIAWGLSGTDSDDFNIDAGALTFKNIPDFEKPADDNGDNEYLVTVQATDGVNPASLDVTVTVINSTGAEEPSITTTSRPSLTLQENGTGTIYTFRARDPQGRPIRWSLTGADESNFTISGGALTFISPPDFEVPADANGDNVYELTVVVTDDQGLTDSFDFTVTVTNHHENREPAITTGPSSGLTYQKLNYQENRTSTVHTYRARNYGPGPIRWSLLGPDLDSFDINELGALTFKSAPNYEALGSSGNDNDYEIAVVASNSGGYSDTLDVVITVTDVNEGPEVSRAGSAPGSVPENQDQLQVLARYTATDPEGGTVSRWRTSGTDGGDFVISEQGELRFRNTPDYERPADSNGDNVYVFTVQVSDGRNYGSFDETVTVTDVNEPPTITTTSSSATVLRQNENVTSRLYTYRATDPEGADTVAWSVEGVDAKFFTITERGEFSFKEDSPPDFERPADVGEDNVYNVVVQATDDGGNPDTLDVVITVTGVNEGPEVTSGESSFTISENQDLPSAVYTGFDPEGESVTRWSVGGTDGGDFVISQEGVLTFRSIPDFEHPVDADRDNIYELQVRPYDGRYYGSFEVTVTVNDVNEPPTITTTSSSATALRQNENATSRLYTYRATDPERGTITWSVGGEDKDFFIIDDKGALSFASPPDFEVPADVGRDNVYNVVVRATDDGGNPDTLDVVITVTGVNEGPEVTSGESSFTISQNQDLPSAAYAGFDPEGESVTRWTVGGTDGGDFTISQEGVLTFRSIPDFERPVDANRDNTYQLQVRPYDGRYYGSFDVTVTVNDVNEPPTITTTNSSATMLRQNENATSRLYTYRATDPEGADTVAWSVEGVDARFFDIDERGGQFSFKEDSAPDFEDPTDSGEDNVYNVVVQATDDDNNPATLDVTVTVENDAEGEEPTITTRRPPATYRENGTSAVYTFRASEPQRGPISWSLEGTDREDFTITADSSGRGVLAFTSPPDYENPADSDRQNDYELTVIATDQDGHIDRLSFTITVTEVDEGPEVEGPPRFSIAENESLSNAVYTATDPEGLNVARWSVGGRDGGDFFITQGGTLYFRSLPDYESPADSDRDNVYEVTIQPSDGRNNGAYPVTVTVTNVNEPPEIRSGSKTSFMQPENRTSRLHTYSAADPEGGTVTWAVAGIDGGLFTIDERGQFSFREEDPPDFDNPGDVGEDNVYDVTIQARDPQSKTASLPVTVTVTEVNEGPVITRRSSAPGRVTENQSVTRVLATYTAMDPERPGVTITRWSTAGRDGGDFVINALGQLMFRNPPDYERPADSDRDNVYEVTIRASDGRNTGSLEEVQRVTVTDVDEAPIITTSRTAFTQPEDRTSTLYTFRATDPEGGDVSWGLSGTDSSAFTMSETGALSFTNPPDYEQPADSGRDNVYEVTIRASDGRNAGTLDVTATVTDHNEGQEPTISTRRPPATYRENGTSAVYTFRASDPQRGSTITWTVEGTDRGDFTITADSSGRGVLAFRNSPDFESPEDADRNNEYELAVVATDDDGNTDRVDFAIAVTDHNEGVEPTISTRRPPSTYRENDTRTVYTFRATDPQRGAITWRLEGTDREDFTITPDSSGRGVLAFDSPPDFESPKDEDRDSIYELAVVATDDDGNTDRLDFAIAVTDVNEGPVITLEGTETTTVSENTPDTKVLADYTATDPEDPTANIFRWSTAGRDGGDFVISDLGELRFRSSPDYERPADSNRDNVYEVTVRAYDGRVYGAHDVTVTVAQMNEAPVITTKSRTEFTLRENFTAVLYTYRATDQDEDDAVTWSVEGADGGDFAIYNGILNFRLLPDLENPVDEDGDNVYEITVVVADRAGLRDTVDAVITITDQSEGPVIAGPISHTVAENYDIAQVLGSYTATDAKDNRPVHPRWSLSGRDGGDFSINEDGELTFRNIPDYDRPADSDRDSVYEVTVRGHDSQAYGNLDVTVTVTPVNEHDPVITGRETLSFRENTAVETRLHTYRATDGDRDTSFAWSLEGDDAGDFAIDEGVLTFSAPPDYEGPADRDGDNVYQVTVVGSDGAKRGTLDVTVTVTEQNDGPVVSGAAEFTTNENHDLAQNQGGSSTTYTALDPEAVGGVTTAITWRLSGRDGGDFYHRPGFGGADLPVHAGSRASRRRQPGQRVRGHRAGPRRPELRRLRGDGDGGGRGRDHRPHRPHPDGELRGRPGDLLPLRPGRPGRGALLAAERRRRRGLHHRPRERGSDLPVHARSRASRRLQPGQRVQLHRAGLRRQLPRDAGRDGHGECGERTSRRHGKGQPEFPGEHPGHHPPPHLPGHRPGGGRLHLGPERPGQG